MLDNEKSLIVVLIGLSIAFCIDILKGMVVIECQIILSIVLTLRIWKKN